MKNTVSIRNRNLVEVNDSKDVLVAKAFRANDHSPWFWGYLSKDGKMVSAGTINSFVPEVTQRKIILAIMEMFR